MYFSLPRESLRVLGSWAADCAERALSIYETHFDSDSRPRAAIEGIRLAALHGEKAELHLAGAGAAAVLATYAALLEPEIAGIALAQPPASHMDAAAPPLLGVLRVMDIPHAVGLLAATAGYPAPGRERLWREDRGRLPLSRCA